MSAYLVDPDIHVLLRAAVYRWSGQVDLYWPTEEAPSAMNAIEDRHWAVRRRISLTMDVIGQLLIDAKAASVNHRHDELEVPGVRDRRLGHELGARVLHSAAAAGRDPAPTRLGRRSLNHHQRQQPCAPRARQQGSGAMSALVERLPGDAVLQAKGNYRASWRINRSLRDR